jgi:hypothetical protein
VTDETAIIDAPAAIEFAVASTGRELVLVQQQPSLDSAPPRSTGISN